MDIHKFREIAVHSARTYYDFLDKAGRGVIEIQVRKITPHGNAFILHLGARLSEASSADLDSLLFSFGGRWHSSHEIAPLEYDKTTVTLRVRPQKHLFSEFSSLSPKNLTLLYDLKFLVKRVEDWYSRHGNKICLPEHAPEAPEIVCPNGVTPSPEQMEAIHGALSTPFSYIWGAPGTGKTRVVLSSCVLSLVCSGQYVLLLAPTNNALEQMLYGVIPACQSAGIPLDHILRLGTPTLDFFKRYPDVCEVRDIERQLQITESRIERIEAYLRFCDFRESFKFAASHITEPLKIMENIVDFRKQALCEMEALQLSGTQDRAKDMLLRRETDRLMGEIRTRQKKLGSTGKLKRVFRPKWYSSECAAIEAAMTELKEKSKQLDTLAEILAVAEQKWHACGKRIAALESDFSEKHSALLDVAQLWPSVHSAAAALTMKNWHSGSRAITASLDEQRNTLIAQDEQYAELADISEDELRNTLIALKKEHDQLLSGSTGERLKDIYILAATLDKFLTLDIPSGSFRPNQIFLDEAGYCSLIKGITPLGLGIPTTFLGDHMQLPPICEMNDDNFQTEAYQSVCLWGQSALYSECIFFQDLPHICEDYLTNEPAPFLAMRKYNLDCTYRFGSSLASILSGTVYAPTFHSALHGETELLVLDAPYQNRTRERISETEADAIAWYLAQATLGDFAILTPYRKQLSLLSSRFRSISKDGRILTIHASQGREWDTVFLSVVDTTDKWFMNSCNPISKGKTVINTAVSRAKKRLILVCDYHYWRAQHSQLIGQLVNGAQRIELTK